MALSASTTSSGGLGDQANNQSPQTSAAAGAGSVAAAPAGEVQPGTATSLLTSQNGVALGGSTLSTVKLGGDTATTSQASIKQAQQYPETRHVNPALLGISATLLIVAVIVFWAISKSAKNTTE